MEAHFEWKKEFSVNVKILDEQHKELFNALDNLYHSILEGRGKEVLPKTFEQLDKYTTEHFATEEKYFNEFNYEGAADHVAKHTEFKNDVAEIKSKAGDRDFNALELLVFLENWFINHILDTDKKYSKTFNKHGLY